MSTLPPGPTESPLFQLIRGVQDPVGFVEDCRRRYGTVYTVRMLGMPPAVTFVETNAVKEIFADAGEAMHAGEANRPVELITGLHGLVRLDGARHRRERKLMMPAVHGERMPLYGQRIHDIAQEVLSSWTPGQAVAVQETMQEITLRVILETVFGVPPGQRQEQLKAALKGYLQESMRPLAATASMMTSGDRIRRFLTSRVAPLVDALGRWRALERLPGVRLARAARDLDALLYAELRERRAVAAERTDVMSVLIQATDDQGERLTDDELRDEMMTLLVAGHETTATTLTWATACVLQHPAVLDELRAEHARVFGAAPFKPERVKELRYAEAVAKETLRLYPVSLGVARLLKEPATVGGYSLPAGVIVAPSIYLLQRDPTLWSDPLKFDPARFLDHRPKPTVWLPFGGGLRTCLGMAFSLYEMRVVLSLLFHHATLHPMPGPLPRLAQRGILLGPASPITARFEGWRVPFRE